MTDPPSGYRDLTVLVTGASGVIGGWLVEDLVTRGARVVTLLRDHVPDSQLVRSGLASRMLAVHGSLEADGVVERALFDYDVDVVFHLAAQTQVQTAERHPLATLEANVRGTYLVLEAARRRDPPIRAIVVASSDKAYGESTELPYREDHPLRGTHIYDVSKSAADLISAAYAASFGLPLGIVRCGNVYGGGDLNWERIVPGTVRALLHGTRPVIRSDGSPRRDYIYVKDAVSAYLTLGEALLSGHHHGEAFNFGNGRPVTVVEIVDEIRSIMGCEDIEPMILGTARHEIADQFLDASKAADVLGWEAAYSLRAGLEQTVGWYRELLV